MSINSTGYDGIHILSLKGFSQLLLLQYVLQKRMIKSGNTRKNNKTTAVAKEVFLVHVL